MDLIFFLFYFHVLPFFYETVFEMFKSSIHLKEKTAKFGICPHDPGTLSDTLFLTSFLLTIPCIISSSHNVCRWGNWGSKKKLRALAKITESVKGDSVTKLDWSTSKACLACFTGRIYSTPHDDLLWETLCKEHLDHKYKTTTEPQIGRVRQAEEC